MKIKNINPATNQKINSASTLLRIVEVGRKYNLYGSKDASKKMDSYLWDKNLK